MTTTSTYSFDPSAGDVLLNAFGMIQIRRTELTTGHLEDAKQAFNLLMVDISNRNPNWWQTETVTVPLVLATPTYTLDNRILAVTAVTVQTTAGTTTRDRTIGPMSAADYRMQPSKTKSGPPTTYLFSLLKTPTITIWPVPDSGTISAGGSLQILAFRQSQDVDLSMGYTVDSPYRFLDAITTGLSARLAEIYRPEKADKLEAMYEKRYSLASRRDQEQVPMRIMPDMSSYFR